MLLEIIGKAWYPIILNQNSHVSCWYSKMNEYLHWTMRRKRKKEPTWITAIFFLNLVDFFLSISIEKIKIRLRPTYLFQWPVLKMMMSFNKRLSQSVFHSNCKDWLGSLNSLHKIKINLNEAEKKNFEK